MIIDPTDTTTTLGGRLRALREARGMTLQQVAHKTRVPAAKLAALEAERWADLPAAVYTRGFIRSAAALLGASPDVVNGLVEQYRRDAPAAVVEVPSLTKSDLLIPILTRSDEQEKGRAVLGILLLALAGLAIPIVAFLIS
ncbi:MAG TPA: helix-turn-helix transcriptional regulator [Myxococcota bacterium]|jgi:cytoskeletal protein RodZ|nr:helix-turn-helix transcriptional regulator [Myxococcota bacterium]